MTNYRPFDGVYAPWYTPEEGSRVTRVVIGDQVTSIGNHAFSGCSELKGVLLIPDSVTRIGEHAFDGCAGLTGELDLPDGVGKIQACAFRGCTGFTGQLVLPKNINSIGTEAFQDCTGFSGPLVIPDSGNYISIWHRAFRGCTGLSGTLEIHRRIYNIDDGAFAGVPFTGFRVAPENGNYYSSDGVLFLKDGTELLAYPAGKGAGPYTVPDGVEEIGDYAFENAAGLTAVTFPESVDRIGSYAFSGCARLAGELVIPDSVYGLGYGAFQGCARLARVSLSAGDSDIPNFTFSGCSALTTIYIPGCVDSIGHDAFAGCSSLASVFFSGSEEAWKNIDITSNNEPLLNAVIYCNGQPLSLPTVTAQVQGSAVKLTVTGGTLRDGSTVFAVNPGQTAAYSGTYSASTGEAEFGRPLPSKCRLFFLAPNTLIPLAVPTELP